MSSLTYVGAAYAVIWILIFTYAWRLTSASHKLAERIEELEREAASRGEP